MKGLTTWRRLGWSLVMVLSCMAILHAQEITESWVADQLGGDRDTERQGEAQVAEPGMPVVSLTIRYLPATGELTLASAAALRPLYNALYGLAPARFQVVCCTGLPPERAPELSRQLARHLSQLFADRQPHVQVLARAPVKDAVPVVRPQGNAADAARIEIYRLP